MKSSNPTGFFNRRSFLKASAVVAVSMGGLGSRLLAANSDIRMAVIGLGNKGHDHAENFAAIPGVRVVALCDVDPNRLASSVERLKQRVPAPYTTTDPRKVIERSDVDAVVVATPNHWHALLAVWAMRAGKDVYVEKPVTHNIWEGTRLVEEAKTTGRIVQAGTQYRSCPGLRAAAAWLQGGNLGKPLWAHVVWYEHRAAIGKCAPFKPDWLDYDLYCGPAPLEPLTRPKLHYDWHWVWTTGDGDLGNSGIHAFDACRMFLPGAIFPRRVLGLGARFRFDDAGQTPNTQFTLLEYPALPIIIENRNLSEDKQDVVMGNLRNVREGFVLQYEGGYFAGLRAGGAVLDNKGKEIKRFRGDGGGRHAANFIDAVRSRRAGDLHAPISEGHISSAVCHLGNTSYRLGEPSDLNTCQQALGTQPPVVEGLGRLTTSLEGIGLDVNKSRFNLGLALETEITTGRITSSNQGKGDRLEAARILARGTYRQAYAMPSKA